MANDIIVTDNNQLSTMDGTVVPFVASFDTDTPEGKAKAFNAANAADDKLADHVGEQIELAGYYIEAIAVTDDVTGESEYRPHVVIIDKDGVCYEAQSKVLPGVLQRLDAIYHLTEGNTVMVEVYERKARVGRMLGLKVVA